MTGDKQKKDDKPINNKDVSDSSKNDNKHEQPLKDKLAECEDKLLRSLAEIENQRRRFEKEIKDAFEFGSFNFAKENLAMLKNIMSKKEIDKAKNLYYRCLKVTLLECSQLL